MRRCEVWGLVQCPRLAVEVLVFLNPRINSSYRPAGELAVCAEHLDVELEALTFG